LCTSVDDQLWAHFRKYNPPVIAAGTPPLEGFKANVLQQALGQAWLDFKLARALIQPWCGSSITILIGAARIGKCGKIC
jgi:hypothetical protein